MGIAPQFRPKFCILMTALLVLNGCNVASDVKQAIQAAQQQPKPDTSGELLEQEARYVVADVDGLSPLEAHMHARKMVDPADTAEEHEYTYKVPRGADLEEIRMAMKKKYEVISDRSMVMALHKRKPGYGGPSAIQVAAAPKVPESKSFEQEMAEMQDTQATEVSQVSPAAGAPVSVLDVRTGDHPDKTRFVLDLSGPAQFEYQMDDAKHVLMVQLPDAAWSTEDKHIFSDHPLLLAYLARPSPSGGTFLAIKMKKKAELVFKTAYEPNGQRGHRLVFDVSAG